MNNIKITKLREIIEGLTSFFVVLFFGVFFLGNFVMIMIGMVLLPLGHKATYGTLVGIDANLLIFIGGTAAIGIIAIKLLKKLSREDKK